MLIELYTKIKIILLYFNFKKSVVTFRFFKAWKNKGAGLSAFGLCALGYFPPVYWAYGWAANKS